MRQRLENTVNISHNFHNRNWEHQKEEPQGYHVTSLDQNRYVAPSVKEALIAYKRHLERIIQRLDYTINSNVPDVIQEVIGQPTDWYHYQDGPDGEKNHSRFSVTIDLPIGNGEDINQMIHPQYMMVLGGRRED